MTIPQTPIAIIGIGCLYPKAADRTAFWANIVDRVDVIGPVPPERWNPDDYCNDDPKKPDHTYARRGGFLEPTDFPPLDFGISPNTLEGIDSNQLLGLVVARQALEDAGYGPLTQPSPPGGEGSPLTQPSPPGGEGRVRGGREFDRNRTGVILGLTGTQQLVIPLGARLGHPIWRKALKDAGVPSAVAEDVVQRIGDAYVPWIEDSFPGLLGNVAAGRIANRLDLGGTNCVVDAACASSLSAVHLALLELSMGRTDLVLTGGFDVFNDIFMYMCFSKTPALSPSGDARPFDRNADGTILGEGLGCIVLKRLADAERDGDKIYAVIKGMGTSSDGKGQAIYAPSPAGQMKALRRAYEEAGVSADTIELVEAHGTGTKAGDAAEIAALTEVYRSSGKTGSWCAVGSIKSQLGHTKAAAGASGLIKAALALHHKVLPPTIKITDPIDALKPGNSPLYINTEKRPWLPSAHPRRAAVSAFGFGGSNFHCVVEEYQPAKTAIDWDGQVQIVAFSAASEAELWQQVDAFETASRENLRHEAALTRARFSTAHAFRLVLVIEPGKTDLARLLDGCRKLRGQRQWNLPDGACFGSGPAAGDLACLFPGQGSQYVGMLRDLACQFPQVLAVLSEANNLGDGRRLGDFLYPLPVFNDADRKRQEEQLRATDIAQPALGAVSLGALRVLEHFGVRPAVVAGHSYGELVALCAAGRIDESTLNALSRERGRLMASAGGGAMLAVAASFDQVADLLKQESLDLTIANKNAPNQVVLSGQESEIDRALAACQKLGLRGQRLPVAAAFHSPLVAGVRDRFQQALASAAIAPATLPVYANTTGQVYPADADATRALLAGQLAAPVEFVAQIQRMHQAGVRTFVEVGPGNKLTGLVSSILEGRESSVMAIDSSSGRKAGDFDLARVLAQLAALGHAVNLTRWDDAPRPEPRKKPALTVPISGANHVRPRPARPPAEPLPTPSANGHPTMSNDRNGHSHERALVPSPPPPRATTVDPALGHQALQATQANLLALQKLGEQTAKLHGQFLEGQDRALQAMQSLLEQQRQLFGMAGPLAVSRPPAELKTISFGSERETASGIAAAPAVIVKPTVVVAPPPPPAADSGMADTLLKVVAEKTGYPVETLQLEMELDADLGIDSIKRVEIFSALQDQLPHAPAIKPEHLGTLRTLQQVVAFLGNGAAAAPTMPAPPVVPAAPADNGHASEILLATVAEKTGYPVEMLQLDMELDADLGIDSIKRVEIFSAIQDQLPDAPAIKPEHLGTLRTLRQVVAFLTDHAAPLTIAPVCAARCEPVVEAKPATPMQPLQRQVLVAGDLPGQRARLRLDVAAEIWITQDGTGLSDAVAARLEALSQRVRLLDLKQPPAVPERLAGLVLITTDLRAAFQLVQRASPALRQAKDAVLVTVSRLDGQFGIAGLDHEPISGGLAGLAKTAAHEWPAVHAKAIDLDRDWRDIDEAALVLAEEILLDGPIEVGLAALRRCQLRLQEAPLTASGALPLQPGDVVVVTGGGRGVTAETALALAKACQPTLVLLGRTPPPAAEPEWLAPLASEAEIKQALTRQANGQAVPKKIEEQYRTLAASRELRANLKRIEATGVPVSYRAVDVADPAALRGVIEQIRRDLGPVRGLIHGAGVLADRRIEDKTVEQFDQVFGTKVAGLQALLADLPADELKVLVLFSSMTARFGRTGQVDYAIANEVLNKLAQRESRRRPGCKVLALNWGPWDGGMVTPGLKRLFEQEGVGLIPLTAGAEQLVRELATPGPVEIVLLASGSRPPQAPLPEETLTVAFEREISLDEVPILRSHVIGGRGVVPMALLIEWLAHAALQRMAGLHLAGFDELRILKGIRLPDRGGERIRILAGKPQRDGSGYRVPLELHGQVGGRDLLHASVTVLLADRQPDCHESAPALSRAEFALTPAEMYDVLFHGPDLHGIEAIETCAADGMTAWVRTAALPGDWLRQPSRGNWLADPLALDCAFQMMTFWTGWEHGGVSLPCRARNYRQYRRAFPRDGVRVVAHVHRIAGAQVEADLWFVDQAGGVVARMEGYECVLDASLNQAFRQNRLEAASSS